MWLPRCSVSPAVLWLDGYRTQQQPPAENCAVSRNHAFDLLMQLLPDSSHLRWGILGAGTIATRFARDLAHVPNTVVAAVYARRLEQAQALASVHNAVALSSLDAFFAAGLDAVYIATLPDTHHHFVRAALLAGLPVLCEKPVTRSLAELEDLLTLAAIQRLLFMEAMKTPFLPLYRQLRNQFAAETNFASTNSDSGSAHVLSAGSSLGPVHLVLAGNAVPNTPPSHPSWRLDLAGGALLSIGVYQAFLAVDWLGPALAVQKPQPAGCQHLWPWTQRTVPPPFPRSRFPNPQPAVDTLTLVQTQHARGFAQLYAGLDVASPGTATLLAANGFVLVQKPWWNPSRATLTDASGHSAELNAPVLGDGLHYQAEHFVHLLRTGQLQSPIVSHAHSRAVMHLLDRARTAIALRFPGEP